MNLSGIYYILYIEKTYCIYACKTNYSSEKLKSTKISRESKDSAVSALYWPRYTGRYTENLNMARCTIQSSLTTSSPPPQPTIKACPSTRSIEEVKLSEFLGSNKMTSRH